jgi:prevent-host-death family protein
MAVTANIHEAKTTLSKLIERAMAGEEVIIAKAGKPLVHLMPIGEAKPAKRKRGILGAMKGEFELKPGWDSPELDAEIEELVYSKPLAGEYGGFAEE